MIINRKKILVVFGTRPEAIKMAPLVHMLRSKADEFEVQVCNTAQHRHMLDQVLQNFSIRSDFDLNIMKSGQDLFDITSSVLLGMRKVLIESCPNLLLVHGDTTTTMAAAMAGFYANVPVGHVEAGLRTHDVGSPFPEEFNRQIVSKVASWHFAPTELSCKNLLDEGISPSSVTVTGNTGIDTLHWVLRRIDDDKERQSRLDKYLTSILAFDWKRQNFILVTGHRRENFGHAFVQICGALKELALRFVDIQFVYPVHLNPNVQQPVYSLLSELPNISLVHPLEYEPFVYLMKHSMLVVTDSGGIQEEAPSLGKPVLVMRDFTERPEAVQAGTVELVGADKLRIVSGVRRLLENAEYYKAMSRAHSPYGDGRACERILQVLQDDQ